MQTTRRLSNPKPYQICLCLLLCLSLFCVPITSLYAAPPKQDGIAILQLENQSTQPLAICDIFAVRMPTEVVLDLQGQIDLAPGASKQLSVPPGHYRLLVSDCDQKILAQQQDLLITELYVLSLTIDESPILLSPQAHQSVAGEAALQISNETEQIICYVYIANATATDPDEGELFEVKIASGETHSIPLASGAYDVLLKDCHNNTLLNKSGVIIAKDHDLPLTQADVKRAACDTFNQTGIAAYNQGRYHQALPAFQAALACFCLVGDRTGEGASFHNIGELYRTQGQYDEALANYEQALIILQAVGDHSGEGVTLNNIGLVYLAQGRYDEALVSYEQALTIARTVGDRRSEGAHHHNIGTVYEAQGRYDEALVSYEQALTIARTVGDRKSEGTTLNEIGKVYLAQGQYDEALASYEQAQGFVQAVGDRRTEGITLNGIGAVYEGQGQYNKALVSYEQALIILRAVGDRRAEGITLNNIGAVYEGQGQYNKALVSYEQALAIVRAVGDRRSEGITLNRIGEVYLVQGRYGKALANFEQALAIAQAVGDRRAEGTTIRNIGAVYDAQGRYSEALVSYKQALAVTRAVGAAGDEEITFNNIGAVYKAQGQYGESLTNYEQALTIAQTVGDRRGEGIILHNIGAVYKAQGRYGEALTNYEQALTIAQTVGDRRGEGIILHNIGAVYEAQGQYGEALVSYEQALTIARAVGALRSEGTTLNNMGAVYIGLGRYVEASQAYGDSIKLLERVRSEAGIDRARINVADNFATAYTQAISLYYERGVVEQSFWYSERGRARVLLDITTTGQVQLNDSAGTALLAAEQEAYAVHQSAQDALAKARTANPPDPTWVREAEAALRAAEATYEQAAAAIAARSDQLTSLIPGRQQVPQLAEVQALLDTDTTLLSYWTLEDKTLAFIITAKDAAIVELPSVTAQTVLTMTENLYAWRNRDNPHPAPLRQLYQALIAPLVDRLKTPHLAIIPHQTLHYVPFAALVDEAHNKQYLGEQYTLSVLPSASILRFLKQNAEAAQANQAGGAVVFGAPASNEPALPRLSNAATEAGAVAALLNTLALTDTAASEAALWQSAQNARIVHLAAHGAYNGSNALYSAIYLASTAALTYTPSLSMTEGLPSVDTRVDGRLETHEIFGLPLKGNDLVVLSACQTNLGNLSRGDDIVGLTRAFFFAGAPTVIASLWNVDDTATEKLMVSFYTHWLKEGMSKAAALQAAQVDVRAAGWASPFYWAGFVLNGYPGKE